VLIHQQTVGRFEIRDFLGRGAVGDVYLAWDPQRQEEVALKIARVSKTDPEMLEAERNGVHLQAELCREAPQVAAIHELGQDGDFFWVAMEYVAGEDLSQILAGARRLPEERAVTIALQLSDMLVTCHGFTTEIGGRKALGIVHGDIKPENIRLQDGDRVRVLDFGIAKHLSHTRRFTVNLFGSLPYTPPERLEKGVVNLHSDLWALGVVLYRMVAGYPPYAGDNAEEMENRIRHGEAPEPLPPDVSLRLARIIRKTLAFEVGRRYQTAAELKADLEAFQDGRPLLAEAAEEPREDPSATRRTWKPLEDAPPSETRRTDPPPVVGETQRTTAPFIPPPPPPGPAPIVLPTGVVASAPVPAPVAEAAPRRRPWANRFVFLLVLACLLAASQMWAWNEMEDIRHDLVSQAEPNLQGLAERYRKVSRVSLLGPLQSDTRTELRGALSAAADRILASYHGDNPTTTERGWQRAHEYLRTALDIDYDRETRARMIYTKAHLDRIEAQSLRAKRQRDPANDKSRDAVAGFREAARRSPDWPDPYMGLARIYAYERFDLEELQKALGEMARRGYRLGRREKAMLADGYRMRGRELLARAQKTEDPDEEIRFLEQSRDHLSEAIAYYGEIPGFGDVQRNRADAEAQLEQAMFRLWELGF
jgi:serine/threonine protein kinase